MLQHTPAFDEVLSYHFDSGNEGPHLLLLGGIHGNEVCGQIALKTLKEQLETGKLTLEKGKLTLVPQCNPWACAANVRYIDKNLNRVITRHTKPEAYEERIANQIIEYIENCDAMVDIHSAHAGIGPPFIFNDYPSKVNDELAHILGGTYIIGGWAEMDPTGEAALTTQAHAHLFGKHNCLIECGEHTDPDAIKVAARAAHNAMVYFGLITGEIDAPKLEHDVKITGVVYKKAKGHFVHENFKHMQRLEKGQIVAKYDTGEEVPAPQTGFMILPFYEAKVGDEWFYYGEPR